MKVLLYVNPDKDTDGKYSSEIRFLLEKHEIEYSFVSETEERTDYDALLVFGGDGTLLRRTKIANKSGLPIIGINGGKLGFLTEFEFAETEMAIVLLKSGMLVPDARATLKVTFNDETFYALNDATVSRIYEENKRMVVNFGIRINQTEIQSVSGDGIIVATPTGSTAYSLSAGGAVLAPSLNAFCITPIASHSVFVRSIVYSSDNKCTLTHQGGSKAGLFVDGKLVAEMHEGDTINICKAEKDTVFLRKNDFNFFSRLSKKFQNR